ncbi:MAG TPA: YceI family protein [Agriterribacter sp.]|nr:YceI family protein [Agriterribacter sp.]
MFATKWVLDAAHSEISFKIRHLMITNVTGSFKNFNSVVESGNGDFSGAKINFTAETASIDTNNEQRDGHLKSADFFDAEKYPEIKFEANGMKKKSADEYELEGNLTLHGASQPIKLKVETGGVVTDGYGQTKAGFSVSGKINRKDFGLTWNALTEAGGVTVSDEVKIAAEVQYVKQ